MRIGCLAFLFWVVAANGQTATAASQIDWSAPLGCPEQEEVVRQVEHLLGQPLDQPRQHSVSILAGMRGLKDGRYQVELVFTAEGRRRTRRLQHGDCTQLAEGAALVMAMAIDPERVHLPAGSAPPAESPDDSPAASRNTVTSNPAKRLVAPPMTQEKSAPRPDLPHVRWHAALGTLLQGGLLPTVYPGVAAELSVVPTDALRFGFTGTYGLASRITFEPRTGAQAEFTQWGAGAVGCWQNSRRWHWAACAQAEFGRIRGTGRNVAAPQSRTDSYSAVVAGLEGGYGLTHWLRVQGGAGAGVLLARPRYTVENFGEVHRPAFWLLRGTAGLAVILP